MGRGFIQENLGEGHYRVALDIDVRYAREQLAAIQAYLAEFQKAYQDAIDRKDQAKAALGPINTRLHEYLAAAQAESKAAYEAMIVAYEFWRDLVAAQPGAEGASFLRQALTDASKVFDEAHATYHASLLNSGNEDIPPPAVAWQRRSNALMALAVAQGQWSNGVGPIEDEAAVNDAYDLLGVALDMFNAATVEYADAVQNLTPDQAEKLSAMNYYQGEFITAHGDWINTVEENSGLIYVKKARDAYEQAVTVFRDKQKALASLLDRGGMPGELAAIQTDLEKAYTDYRTALEDYQSLMLLKAEKSKARDDLQSKLLPFTEDDGVTAKPPVVNAWCADLSDTLALGTPVATVEIPGERQLAVRIRPQFGTGNDYSAPRDGRLQPAFASSPGATFWNWALHPGAEKWRPRYRLGRIQALDPDTDTCEVELDPQNTGEPTRARDGQTLEVNAPVKTVIDPQTGEQLSILPSTNVQVAGAVTTLLNVPIHYMDCHAQAFSVGDAVLVEFTDRDWNHPQVIGFADHPKPCQVPGMILTAHVNGETEQVFLKETLDPSQAQLRHPRQPPLLGGNLDWTASEGKTRLSFDGPLGRAIPPWIFVGYLPPNAWGDQVDYALTNVRGYLDAGTPQRLEAGQPYYLIAQRYTANLYCNGKRLGQIPASEGGQVGQPRVILGAAVLTYQDATIRKRYLVAVATVPLAHGGYAFHETALACKDLASRPECIDHRFFWAEWPAGQTQPITDWHLFHTEPLSQNPANLPPTGFYAFSGSGTRFVSLIPVMAPLDSAYPGQEDYTILRGELAATADGVTLATLSLTPQSINGQYDYTGDKTEDYPYGNDEAFHSTGSITRLEHLSSSAVVAIDWVGETEMTLTGTLTRQDTYSHTWDHLDDPLYGGLITRAGATDQTYQVTATVTDIQRQRSLATVSINSRSSRQQSLSVQYDDNPANGSQSQQIEDSLQILLRRPVYYDLRSGAGVYLQVEHSRHTGNSSAAQCTIGEVGSADQWVGESTLTTTQSLQIRVHDGDNAERANFSWQDQDSSSTPIDYPYDEGNLMDVIGGPIVNASGPWRAESAASANTVPWAKSYLGNRWVEAPLTLYCQPANAQGATIARGNHPITLEWAEARVWPLLNDRLNYVFASHLDLDALWQSHLEMQHPVAESEPPLIQTALAADLRPGFRV